jgi:hypothetical protein
VAWVEIKTAWEGGAWYTTGVYGHWAFGLLSLGRWIWLQVFVAHHLYPRLALRSAGYRLQV